MRAEHPQGADRMGSDDRQDEGAEQAPSQSFEACYADVAPALFAWAELRIRPSMRARLEPQDLVQEVWLRGMKSFVRFEERGISFRAWAFKIGKNILMEAIRATRTDPGAGASASQSLLSLDGIPQSITSFTQHLAREDSVRAFLAHAAELDESDRMLLIHCGLEDETCAEAAVKLGLTEDAAIKRWQRLKARLRERPWARTFVDLE
jgi:RNA polymerase sigma factor (sigma-70 family)